jgi:repressor LexA
MSEEDLSIKAREALRHIRNWLMRYGKVPSVRDLMNEMDYKSPRSAMLLMAELEQNGFLKKKSDSTFQMIKDLATETMARTVAIPLVGSVTCGTPMLAEENVEAMIPVSTLLAKPGFKYFLLRANGDSMDKAGINNGDLILVKQQPVADNGQRVVALIDDEATVKEFQRKGDVIALVPQSNNSKHKPIILDYEFQIQGIVIATIPSVKF